MQEDKYIKMYESTNLIISKYQDRLTQTYFFFMLAIISLFSIFTWFFFDILGKVELGELSNFAEAGAYFFYATTTIALGISGFIISYAYFVPESNLLKAKVYDYERREILIAAQGLSLEDIDDMFVYFEGKIDSNASDHYVKRYYILKDVLTEKIFELLENNDKKMNFSSKFLNMFD